MTALRLAAAGSLVAAAAMTLVACSLTGPTADRPAAPDPTPLTASTAPVPATPTPGSQSALPTPDAAQETQMRIRITTGDQPFQATVDNSAAARDLIAQLPVTVQMEDHGGVEKTGALPSPLSLDGQPAGADPAIGDLGYYAPGNDLVLYYGDQSSYPGIIILGRLDGDAAERIAELDGSLTVTVEAVEE